MDRLPALITIAAITWMTLLACDAGRKDAPVASRADTTRVAQKVLSTEAFCDVHFPGTTGPLFAAPPLTGGSLPASTGTWRWVNVWATWCKPCVEEMPRLAQWRTKLGTTYDLAFVSVDENDADLAAFRTSHPDTPASPRLANPTKQAEWLTSLGLDGAAPVPIHIFVEPQGHVRCARAGGVREQDFAAVQKLLGE